MNYDLVIYDLDGTLLDTLEDLADSMNATLADRGLPTFPVEDYKTFVGDGVGMLVKRTAPATRADKDLHIAVMDEMRQHYGQRWRSKTRPYDGIEQLVETLREKGVRQAVVSNKPHDFTQLCVRHFFPGEPFEMVIGVCNTVPPKPDPTGVRFICERLGVQPERVLYLGDTNTDMETAVTAGFFPVGALWGFRSAEELETYGARALVGEPAEVVKLVCGS